MLPEWIIAAAACFSLAITMREHLAAEQPYIEIVPRLERGSDSGVYTVYAELRNRSLFPARVRVVAAQSIIRAKLKTNVADETLFVPPVSDPSNAKTPEILLGQVSTNDFEVAQSGPYYERRMLFKIAVESCRLGSLALYSYAVTALYELLQDRVGGWELRTVVQDVTLQNAVWNFAQTNRTALLSLLVLASSFFYINF